MDKLGSDHALASASSPADGTAPTPSRFWDRRARDYAKKPVRDEAAYERTLERVRAHLTANDRVLELGCGTGSTALKLAGNLRELLATDYSDEMIAIATAKARAAGVTQVQFRKCTLDDAVLLPGSFDVVLAMNLLHLLDDIPSRLARIRSLLRPGGLFISKTPCLGDKGFVLRVVVSLLRAVRRAPYVNFLSERSLGADIVSAGFDVLETGMYPKKSRSFFVVARAPGALVEIGNVGN
jgi:2-polyprenyl-3-methyl-5-hydroxy-6-metoxy-1,4-benzoquinol methylase